jgi:hypothetical protein
VAAASGGEGGTAEVAVRKDWDAESARLAARALRAGEPASMVRGVVCRWQASRD